MVVAISAWDVLLFTSIRIIVRRTEGVSGAFIKELMRRATQFNLERNGRGVIVLRDIENALDEIFVAGGSLNLKLLGGHAAVEAGREA